MLSLPDGGWFSPRMILKIACEKEKKKKRDKNNYVRDRALSRFWSFWSSSLMLKGTAHSWHHQCVWPGWPGQDTAVSLCLWGGICCRWLLRGKFSSRDQTYPLLSCSAINQGEEQALFELSKTALLWSGQGFRSAQHLLSRKYLLSREFFGKSDHSLRNLNGSSFDLTFSFFFFFKSVFYPFRVGGWFL